MNQDQQPRQDKDTRLEVVLLLVGLLLAWPAFLLGIVSHQLIKRHINDPLMYWISAALLGTIGVWVLFTHANPYPFLLVFSHDVGLLVRHLSAATAKQVVLDALPVWERSIVLFPWVSLAIELFAPKNLEATLLAQERQRQAGQVQKSHRAARKVANAPDQINGKAVLGALIDNPSE